MLNMKSFNSRVMSASVCVSPPVTIDAADVLSHSNTAAVFECDSDGNVRVLLGHRPADRTRVLTVYYQHFSSKRTSLRPVDKLQNHSHRKKAKSSTHLAQVKGMFISHSFSFFESQDFKDSCKDES